MKILILAVGKLRDKRIVSIADEYLQRIRPAGLVAVERTSDVSVGTTAERMEREGQELLRRLKPRDKVILLRDDGIEYDSRAFAGLLDREIAAAAGRVVFVIGGPWGVSDDVKGRANMGVSFSRMTFTHEMCFLFLAEQLYRAFSILNGTSYHH